MFRNKDAVSLSPSLVDYVWLAGVYVTNVCVRQAAGGPAVTDTRD